MPHIILETTADLVENGSIPDILEALVRRLASFETIESPAIKAYHTLRPVWSMGEGAPPGFAHLTVGLISGRDRGLLGRVADAMMAEMRAQFAESVEGREAGLTLEVREFDRELYRKTRT